MKDYCDNCWRISFTWQVMILPSYGSFTLHGNWNATGSGNGTGTIADNGPGPIPVPDAVWTVTIVPSPVPGPDPSPGTVQCERAIIGSVNGWHFI